MKKYRKDEIVKHCSGKSVLHLGFVQHTDMWRNKIANGDWLHNKLMAVATKVVGLDYLKESVNIIREELDIECYFADVTKLEELDLNEKFDVVVCGELIEHIANPGLMLDGLKKFMEKDSLLIITTPNPWRTLWVDNIYSNNNELNWVNNEHVCWYSYQTLKQLLERYDYKEISYDYYYAENYFPEHHSIVKRIISYIFFWSVRKRENKNIKNKYEGLFFISKL